MLELLGLESLLESGPDESDASAEALLAERERARGERDFARVDALRDELAELGWEIRDTPEGARLRRRG
jgi:cysteinyl-tRNA synthetase